MKKELEQKLNNEYKDLGTIKISEMTHQVIQLSDIEYLENLMKKVKPLNVNEPIVVAEIFYKTNKYTLIDGYHRLKYKLNNQTETDAYVLKTYEINRKYDTLYQFMQSLVGKTIKFVSNDVIFVDDVYCVIKGNKGCGGCSNGWSTFNLDSKFLNKAIKINNIEQKTEGNVYESDLYDLYINGKKIAEVDTGYGNGYYGGDFEIEYYK
jgi:hypothetical protein